LGTPQAKRPILLTEPTPDTLQQLYDGETGQEDWSNWASVVIGVKCPDGTCFRIANPSLTMSLQKFGRLEKFLTLEVILLKGSDRDPAEPLIVVGTMP